MKIFLKDRRLGGVLKPGNLNGSRVCVIPSLGKFLQLVLRGSCACACPWSLGPGPLGPWALAPGPWALGPLPLGPWALAPGPWALGPLSLGPWALVPGPLGPWALGLASERFRWSRCAPSPQPPYQPLGWSYRYWACCCDLCHEHGLRTLWIRTLNFSHRTTFLGALALSKLAVAEIVSDDSGYPQACYHL